jgi:hypothetical protein
MIRRSKVDYNGFSTFDLLKNVKMCKCVNLMIKILANVIETFDPLKKWLLISFDKSHDHSFDLLKNVTFNLLKFNLMNIPLI